MELIATMRCKVVENIINFFIDNEWTINKIKFNTLAREIWKLKRQVKSNHKQIPGWKQKYHRKTNY